MEPFHEIQVDLDRQLQSNDEEFDNSEDLIEAQINDQAYIRSFEDDVALTSEAAHAKRTREEYKRKWSQFLGYIIDPHGDEGMHQVYNNGENCPVYIAHWIYLACDEDSLKKSEDKSSSPAKSKKTPNKYSSAQVMRAAVSYGFAITLKRGHIPWAQLENGVFIGNPSLSTKVLTYMRSLPPFEGGSSSQGVMNTRSTIRNPEPITPIVNMNPSTQDSGTEVGSEAQALQQRLAALQEGNAILETKAVARENMQRLEGEIRIEEAHRECLRSEA